MRIKYALILFFSFVLYNLIMYLIERGILFSEDSHARYFYVVFVPYYFVLIAMSMFYRYKVLTLIFILPISILVWKVSDILLSSEPGSVPVDALLVISLVLLMGINELLFYVRKK